MKDQFSVEQLKYIDYKDTDILKKFLTSTGRIQPRTRTGLSAKNQRRLTQAIKRARYMGLIPYIYR